MFMELHREEKRKETEVAMRIKGRTKRRETDSASNQFPKCSPQPRTWNIPYCRSQRHSRCDRKITSKTVYIKQGL